MEIDSLSIYKIKNFAKIMCQFFIFEIYISGNCYLL